MQKYGKLMLSALVLLLAIFGVYITFSTPKHLGDDAETLITASTEVGEVEAMEEALLETEFVVEDKLYPLSVPVETNVIDLMKLIQDQNDDFSFNGTEYEGMGMLVEQINDTENNMDESMFWSLYVNDELAQVGASQYIIQDGDIINWRYEKVEF
ncbi:MAG: DUF4430 domain-containing protein [Patescibacteria group bacterium]